MINLVAATKVVKFHDTISKIAPLFFVPARFSLFCPFHCPYPTVLAMSFDMVKNKCEYRRYIPKDMKQDAPAEAEVHSGIGHHASA